jgi:hypothetical protein
MEKLVPWGREKDIDRGSRNEDPKQEGVSKCLRDPMLLGKHDL